MIQKEGVADNRRTIYNQYKYQTLEEQTVTVRKRDDASQERVDTAQLLTYLQDQLKTYPKI